MPKSISVIGNVQLDVLAGGVTKLPDPGGDDIIGWIAVRPAGAAGNVSLALTALGAQHRLFGAVGEHQAGRWVAQEPRRLGAGDDLTVVAGDATAISIALEAPERERASRTAHGVLESYDASRIPVEAMNAELLLFTGYFSMPAMRGTDARRTLSPAKKRGACTVFDTGWDPENWQSSGISEVLEMLEFVDVFLPNEPEALALTGTKTAEGALEHLIQHFAGWVVIKRGDKGIVAGRHGGEYLQIAAPRVNAVDTTGAGDSLAAGMLADLAAGEDMGTALATGVAVASAVVSRPSDTRYPTRQELAQFQLLGS